MPQAPPIPSSWISVWTGCCQLALSSRSWRSWLSARSW